MYSHLDENGAVVDAHGTRPAPVLPAVATGRVPHAPQPPRQPLTVAVALATALFIARVAAVVAGRRPGQGGVHGDGRGGGGGGVESHVIVVALDAVVEG